jgi:hypothetical protein
MPSLVRGVVRGEKEFGARGLWPGRREDDTATIPIERLRALIRLGERRGRPGRTVRSPDLRWSADSPSPHSACAERVPGQCARKRLDGGGSDGVIVRIADSLGRDARAIVRLPISLTLRGLAICRRRPELRPTSAVPVR